LFGCSVGWSVGWWPGAYFPQHVQIHAVMTRVDKDNEVNDGSSSINNKIQSNIRVNKTFPYIYLMKDQNYENVRNGGVAIGILSLSTLTRE